MKDGSSTRLGRRRLLGTLAGSVVPATAAVAGARWPSDHGGGVHVRDGCVVCQGGFTGLAQQYLVQRPLSDGSNLLGQAGPAGSPAPERAHSAGVWVVQASWVMVPGQAGLEMLRDHDVVVKGDRIEAVRARRPTSDPKVDARGQILFPGFISGHSHAAAGTLTRGWIEENPRIAPGPSRSYFPAMALIDTLSDDELDDLTALNVAEMIRGGCTTQLEMSLSIKQMKSFVRVATRYGLRSYVCGMVPGMSRLGAIWNRDLGSLQVLEEADKDTLAEISESLAFCKTFNGSSSGRLLAMMGPSVTPVFTAASFKALREAAAQLGNGIHLHVQAGGNPKHNALIHELWKMREIEMIQAQGLLEQRLIAGHCSGLEDLPKDLAIMRDPNFTFVHCPSGAGAGQSMSSQHYPEALAAGVNTSIGFDTHSNDYVENLKLATMGGRARARMLQATSPVAMKEPTMWDALQAATLGGAKGLGRTDIGRLVPGAKADLCTVDVSGLLVGNGINPREPWNNLMYANGLSVRHVMVDGDWKLRDGQLQFADESTLKTRGGDAAKRIWDRLDLDGFFVKMPR